MPFATAMPEPLHFIFLHGWGFTGDCWRFLRPLLPAGLKTHFFNRGYWGNAVPVSWDEAAVSRVAVAHSLGLHFVAGPLLGGLDALVIISGFQHFHGLGAKRGVTRQHIKRMQARLLHEPQALMADFYRDCAYPLPAPGFAEADLALLQKDLRLLDAGVYDIEALRLKKVLIIHGARDRIVPLARAEALQEAIAGSHLCICGAAGHGLPFTHPEFVMQAISDFLQ